MDKREVRIQLDNHLAAKLQMIAEEQKVSVDQVVTKAIDNLIGLYESERAKLSRKESLSDSEEVEMRRFFI